MILYTNDALQLDLLAKINSFMKIIIAYFLKKKKKNNV